MCTFGQNKKLLFLENCGLYNPNRCIRKIAFETMPSILQSIKPLKFKNRIRQLVTIGASK